MNFFCFVCSKPALTEVLETSPSKEPGDQKNREYFKRQKLLWLRSYLLEKGIQIPSDGKNKSFLQVSLLFFGTPQVQLSSTQLRPLLQAYLEGVPLPLVLTVLSSCITVPVLGDVSTSDHGVFLLIR